ncbi:MAG: MarC family protein [Verrucomicrobiota bacterium]
MEQTFLISTTAYFLALINPASKVFLLASMDPPYKWKGLWNVCFRSTVVAFFILILLAVAGNLVLESIFHVHIYSLNVAGGIILFVVGFNAVQKGRFYEETALKRVSDISVVPLAAPFIAGPGTITAAISYPAIHGLQSTILCITLALLLNFLIMLTSLQIGRFLEKINLIGPLIRITGLVVTAVAVQMIFTGCGAWLKELGI